MWFNPQNAVVIACFQVAGIVFGVLASGLSHRLLQHAAEGRPTPWLTRALMSHGWFLLALPLIWITLALLLQRRAEDRERPRPFVTASGFILLGILVMIAVVAVVLPWWETGFQFGWPAAERSLTDP